MINFIMLRWQDYKVATSSCRSLTRIPFQAVDLMAVCSEKSHRWFWQTGSKQVGDRIVETGELHGHPGPQEDDVAHEGLVLECGAECPGITLLPARVGRLQHKASDQLTSAQQRVLQPVRCKSGGQSCH